MMSETLIQVYRWLGQGQDNINEVYAGNVPGRNHVLPAIRQRIDTMVLEAKGKVLDIGCSGGIVALKCAQRGLDVTAIDLIPESIAKAAALIKPEPDEVKKRIHLMKALAERLPFTDAFFDTVLMGQILEHVISPRMVLREATRVLKYKGKLLASVPVGYNKTPTHQRFFNEDSFRNLMGEFVTVIQLKNFDNVQMLAICRKD